MDGVVNPKKAEYTEIITRSIVNLHEKFLRKQL
jgi:hypothetical protein